MKIRKISVVLVALSLSIAFISCKNEGKVETEILDKVVADTIPVAKETTAIQSLRSKEIELLLPTQYRELSTGYPTNFTDKVWYEVYRDTVSESIKISKANLKVSYGLDECVGENVMIISSENEYARLFFAEFEGMTKKPITLLSEKLLIPEHRLSFKFKGKDYVFSATGTVYDDQREVVPSEDVKKLEGEDVYVREIRNYKLMFSTSDGISYQLAYEEHLEGTVPEVVWVGDMNGDDLPDMVLDLSNFYEEKHLYLFLSDAEDKSKPLKRVADFDVVNDC